MWPLLFLVVASACLRVASAQPLSCLDDDQCSAGYFCEKAAHFCRECLRCEDLKREGPSHPLAPNSCIKSVIDCGPCLKGLVVDHRGDVNAECVPADGREGGAWPAYVWVAVPVAMLAVIIIAVFIYFLFFKPDMAKFSFSRVFLQQPSAPPAEAPPPYNRLFAPYTAVRAESPTHTKRAPTPDHYYDGETELTKPTFRWGAREAAGRQAARVFNEPYYVQDESGNLDPITVTSEDSKSDVDDHLPDIHDEETIESVWTPEVTNSENKRTSSSDEDAGALEIVGETSGLSGTSGPPPPKRIRQDTNNNGEAGASAGTSGESRGAAGPSAASPIYLYNVVHINNKL